MVPEITVEQKLKLVLAHRDVITTKAAADVANRNHQDALDILAKTGQSVAKELGVDETENNIDLNALAFIPK